MREDRLKRLARRFGARSATLPFPFSLLVVHLPQAFDESEAAISGPGDSRMDKMIAEAGPLIQEQSAKAFAVIEIENDNRGEWHLKKG